MIGDKQESMNDETCDDDGSDDENADSLMMLTF